MKTFFKSSELPHLWAHNLAQNARCPSAESIEGDSYISYNTVIGRRYEHKGVRCFLANVTSYSVTTSGHQSAMLRAIPSATKVFRIGNLRMGERMRWDSRKQTGMAFFDYAVSEAAECALKAAKARKTDSKEFHQGQQAKWLEDARDISAFFGLRRKVDSATIERLNAAKVRAEKAAAKEEARRQAEQEKQDAAYIVTAANAYPELVRQNGELKEALQELLEDSEVHTPKHAAKSKAVMKARALLSSLKTQGSPKDVLGHAVTETNPVG